MAGYIGAKVGTVTANAADIKGDISSTDTSPDLTLKNTTQEDSDGGRESTVTFKGEQSGGEESTLAEIRASHDGTADDEKGDLIFKTNDGSDGASPTERMRIDSAGLTTVTGSAHFGKTAIETSADTPVIIKSDTDHLALHLEENSGAESWQIGVDAAGDLGFHNSGAADATVTFDDSGNVGIGESAPSKTLVVNENDSECVVIVKSSDTGTAGIFMGGQSDEIKGGVIFDNSDNSLGFRGHNNSERMRIDSDGNLLVGQTSPNNTVTGFAARANSLNSFCRDTSSTGAAVLAVNKKTGTGTILAIQQDDTTIGTIVETSGQCGYSTEGSGFLGVSGARQYIWDVGQFYPVVDNARDLGFSTFRWDDVRATNGTIQTSDENDKEQIASLTDAEITAAKAISKLFKTFKWKDKVESKGDAARTHTGVVAQQVQTAMSDAGLDVTKYAFWCSDTWWETVTQFPAREADEENGISARAAYSEVNSFLTEEEAPEGAVKKTRLGVRYPELLSFIGAATEQRLTSIEARLTALEAE